MNKTYRVELTDEERNQLEELVRKGKGPAYRIRHAYILLNSDINKPKKSDPEIADYLHCHLQTVYNIRKRFVEEGLETALERKQRETPPFSMEKKRQNSLPLPAANLPMDEAAGHYGYSQTNSLNWRLLIQYHLIPLVGR
jgi:hypothetical protein